MGAYEAHRFAPRVHGVPGPRADLAAEARESRRAVPAGRRDRFARAHHRRLADPAPGTAGHPRKPPGCERRHRRRARGPRRPGRLHPALCRDTAARDRAARAEDRLRPGQGLRADLDRRHQPFRARLQPQDRRRQPEAAGRLCQGASGRAELRVAGLGLGRPSHDGALSRPRGAEDGSGAVRGRRQDQRARGIGRSARAPAAAGSDRRRAGLPGIPHPHLERLRRPGGHAPRRRRARRARDRRRLQRCCVHRPAGKDRRRSGLRHAGGVPARRARRPRALEGSRAGGGDQAPMSPIGLRVAIPDLVSPSYFPAIAAVELGCFRQEGFDATVELVFPVTKTYEELREGRLDFVGGASHAALYAFKDWQGGRLLCALAQHMYWFLVVRKDLKTNRGDLKVVRGQRIGAAPGPVDGLKRMLAAAGIDPERDVKIGPVPGAIGQSASFGLLAAKALEDGKIDGFWANGMGAEVAVKSGIGTLVLDARREAGDEAKGYTFPALVASQKLIDAKPEVARAAICAGKAAQQILRRGPARATEVGKKLFPATEESLIAKLIRRDAPYYDPEISPQSVESMNRFARELGLLSRTVGYEDVVWKG